MFIYFVVEDNKKIYDYNYEVIKGVIVSVMKGVLIVDEMIVGCEFVVYFFKGF